MLIKQDTLNSPKNREDKVFFEEYKKLSDMISELIFLHSLESVNFNKKTINWTELPLEEFMQEINIRLTSLISNWEDKTFTWQEQKIFTFLYQNPWKIYSKDNLLNVIGDEGEVFDKIIDVFISRIRNKLPKWIKIKTIRGIGYYLEYWDFPLEKIKNKIKLDDNIYFIPQLRNIFNQWKFIFFTDRESMILNELIKSQGKPKSKHYLKHIIWSEEVQDNTISTFISKIKKKLPDTLKDKIVGERKWYKWCQNK